MLLQATFFKYSRSDLWTSKNNYSALHYTKIFSDVFKAVCVSTLFSGVRNLSLISDERLYLCKSGDEIRSLNDRCDQKADCRDESDERDCVQCKCKLH